MKGTLYVIGGAVGMAMSMVWFVLGGLFVASVYRNATTTDKKKEEA